MDIRFTIERTHYYAPTINVVMAVAILGEPKEEELRTAINKAVQKHEILSSKVYLDKKGESYYSVISPEPVRIETRNMQGENTWKEIIHEQERIPFDKENGEMIRFFLLPKKNTTQLVIVAHHLAGDGLSFIYLVRDIMTALGNPSVSYDKLPINLLREKDFPEDVKINPLIRFMMKQFNKSWNEDKKVFQKEDYLNMFHTYWQDRENAVEDVLITGNELQNLLKKSKEHAVSVNSTIVTAFLMAVQVEKEVGMAVSIRKKENEGMGNYASGISIQYVPDNRLSFWKNARKVHKLIYKKLDRNKTKYFILKFLQGLEPTLIDAAYFSAFAGYENMNAARVSDMFGYSNNPKGISITNLTKPDIPESYGKYSIDRINFVPPLVPNAKRIIGIVTIGERMTITMQYLKDEKAADKKAEFERVIKILRSGL